MFIGQQPKSDIMDNYARYVNSGRVELFRRTGLDFVPGKREGVWMWDVDGARRVLNCRCSGGVFNLGHRPAMAWILTQPLQILILFGGGEFAVTPGQPFASGLGDEVRCLMKIWCGGHAA